MTARKGRLQTSRPLLTENPSPDFTRLVDEMRGPYAIVVISKCECGENFALIGTASTGWFIECSNRICRLYAIQFAVPKIPLVLAEPAAVDRARSAHATQKARQDEEFSERIQRELEPIRKMLAKLEAKKKSRKQHV